MKKTLKKDLKMIVQILVSIDKEQDMFGVLDDLLTPKEIQDISDRIKLLKALKYGKTQREIAKELGISVTTVNRGSRILQFGSDKIEKFI